jgi:hypothetical protein
MGLGLRSDLVVQSKTGKVIVTTRHVFRKDGKLWIDIAEASPGLSQMNPANPLKDLHR